jgi:hypothetical protein
MNHCKGSFTRAMFAAKIDILTIESGFNRIGYLGRRLHYNESRAKLVGLKGQKEIFCIFKTHK